jgi:3,4-dihydroxy-2-butanone 4-phosphate synthase
MIKSGLPHLVRQGRGIVRRIRTRQFINQIKMLAMFELDSTGAALLAERRTKFIQQIEERKNATTTPMP